MKYKEKEEEGTQICSVKNLPATKQETGHLDPSADPPAGVHDVVAAHIIKLMRCVSSFTPSLSSFESLKFVC